MADDGDGAAVEGGEAGDDGGIVAEAAVAVEFDEVVARGGDVVEGVGALLMTREKDVVPGGERGEDFARDLFLAALQFVDLRARKAARRSSLMLGDCSSRSIFSTSASTCLSRVSNSRHLLIPHGPPGREAATAAGAQAGRARFPPGNGEVDHSVLILELRSVTTRRQLDLERALDDARAGEADEGRLFGDDDVTEGGKAGEDAGGEGIGADDDEGNALAPQETDDGGGLRHLQERDDALLHAGAAGGGEHHEGLARRRQRLPRRGRTSPPSPRPCCRRGSGSP